MARAMSMVPGNALPSRKPRRLLVGGAVAAALTVAGGTAVGVVVLQADSPTQAGCYSALSPQADTVEASAELVAEKRAVEACRQTWAEVGDDVDTGNPVSCINEYGGRGVFPAPAGMEAATACDRIGWQAEVG